MTTIEFEALRKQMRAEAAARRAAQKATAAEQGVANPPIAAALGQLGQPEPEPEPVLSGSAAPQSVASDPLCRPFGALAVAARWHSAQAATCADEETHKTQPTLPRGEQAEGGAPVDRAAARAQLASFEVGAQVGLPCGGVHYVPDFVTPEEQQRLLDVLYCKAAQPRWLGRGGTHGRRTQNWGGRPGAQAIAEPLPPFCRALIDALVSAGVFEPELAPNHVLVNEYGPAGGLVAHTDGPLYHPRVACLSLGGTASMKIWRSFEDAELESDGKPGPGAVAQIFLRPRSLNVLSDPVYTKYLHSIDAAPVDQITPLCVNTAGASVAVGDAIPRQERRLSLVFVHKLGAAPGPTNAE
jgi:alkylated DNA repair protein alkB family protein 6